MKFRDNITLGVETDLPGFATERSGWKITELQNAGAVCVIDPIIFLPPHIRLGFIGNEHWLSTQLNDSRGRIAAHYREICRLAIVRSLYNPSQPNSRAKQCAPKDYRDPFCSRLHLIARAHHKPTIQK